MTLLAKNSFGGEQLVFYDSQGRISEDAESLRPVNSKIDGEAIYDFLLYGTILPPHSIFEGVNSLFPGQELHQEQTGLRLENPEYQDLGKVEEKSQSLDDFVTELDELFQNFFSRLLNKNPISIMLSGGIDSGILASYLPKNAVCVTWAGWGSGSSDYQYAKKTFAALGLKEHLVTSPSDQDDEDIFFEALRQVSHPFVFGAGVPYLVMAKRLREYLGVEKFHLVMGENADTISGAFRPTVLSYYFSKLNRFLRPLPFKDVLCRFRRKLFLVTTTNPIELIAFFHSNGIYPGPWISAPKSYFAKKKRLVEEQIGHRITNFQDQILMEELMTEARRDQFAQNYLPNLFGAEMHLPYFDKGIVKLFLQIPQRIRRQQNFGKIVLRRLAEIRGLPKEVIEKGKKGLSYGRTDYFKQGKHLKVWDEMEKNSTLNQYLNVKLLRTEHENNPAAFNVVRSLHYYLKIVLKLS
jgi:asparagine synthetase B (glutamine-hydrolysing)